MALPMRQSRGRAPSSQPARYLTTEPFAPWDDLTQRMGQLMRGVVEEGLANAIDIEDTDDAYLIEIELPGVSPEDVSVDWSDRQLTISGEVKEKVRTGLLRKQTRRYGAFDYTVALPGQVDGENIEATLCERCPDRPGTEGRQRPVAADRGEGGQARENHDRQRRRTKASSGKKATSGRSN